MTKQKMDDFIRKVNARMPSSVTPDTRFEIHPSEWLTLVDEIVDLRERLMFATIPKATPEQIAEARRQGKLPPADEPTLEQCTCPLDVTDHLAECSMSDAHQRHNALAPDGTPQR